MRGEDGTALVLVPVLILVTLLLASIAANSSYMLMQQHRLNDEVEAAANDIANRALDTDRFYASNGVELLLDQSLANQIADEHAESIENNLLKDVDFHASINGRDVSVRGAAKIKLLFRFLPQSTKIVSAHVNAELLRSPIN